jgi:hypothetical protein
MPSDWIETDSTQKVTQVESQAWNEVFGTAKVGAALAAEAGASAAATNMAEAKIALMRFKMKPP